MTPDWPSLAALLDHQFDDLSLLERALTHASAADGNYDSHYERLEFLGDRVLGLVIAELLFRRFPEEAEGQLARRHTALVRKEALALVAEKIGLDSFLVIAKGEEESGERENPAMLADICEAVIAALYLDGGYEVARAWISRHWSPLVDADLQPPRDAKTELQEWVQARGLPLPRYEVTNREGPAHEPHFTVSVTIEGQSPTQGEGRSKRAAEQMAAKGMLSALD